jgi:RND family efflux transporter MFP subunit
MRQLKQPNLFSRRIARILGGITGVVLAILVVLAVGRGRQPPKVHRPTTFDLEVSVVKPEARTLTCMVDQPGFVEAYEQTAIYSKVSGYIQKYYVDIGQQVKKGELLVEMFVPELSENHQQKMAQVELDRNRLGQVQQLVVVAENKLRSAIAQQAEAKAEIGQYDADIVRWESEIQRLTQMVDQNVVNADVLDETKKQLTASRAARDSALATVAARDAARVSARAELGKAKIDVETAKAQVKVAEAEERLTAAMLAYTKVTAPYDGVITVRNANTGDYVQAATGDASASRSSPMFVIACDDLVRIFVDVPEQYAGYVREGTKANVRAGSLSSSEISASVTRTSWSLTQKTRTLRAEIDLSTNRDVPPVESAASPSMDENPLRPGKYVNTKLIVQRPGVFMLPEEAVVVSGRQPYCYLVKDGKAVKTPLITGGRDGSWIEVRKLQIADQWTGVSGNEEVITDHLDELSNGQAVKVAEAKRG